MHKILFRGKRVDNGKWAYGYFADMGNKACIIKSYEPCWDENCKAYKCLPSKIIPVDVSTVGQFIGLYDKYGCRIFEGDIINTHTTKWGTGPVRFYQGISKASRCEIVGNIYDNPELLGKRK